MDRVEPEVLARPNREARSEANRYAAIRVTNRYSAPPRRAFDAWLDPEVAGRWLFATATRPIPHVEIDSRVGGSFRFVDRRGRETVAYTGQYLEIVPERHLVFTLSMDPHPKVVTRVTVAIASLAKGCALKLIHEKLPRERASYMEGRWTGILYGLGVTQDSITARFHHEQE